MNTLRKSPRHPLFAGLKMLMRLIYPRHAVKGMDNVRTEAPAIFICNHMASYAPIVMELYFPFKFRPWVIYDIVTPKLGRDYLEMDFVKKELKLPRPFSRWLAAIIAPLCRQVMRAAEAIPVFKGKMQIKETFAESMEAITQGDNLAIFPEIAEIKPSRPCKEIHTGFIHLARLYYEKTGKALHFYPVFIDKGKRTITIGHPVEFSPQNDYRKEKMRIKVYLQDAINEIALK